MKRINATTLRILFSLEAQARKFRKLKEHNARSFEYTKDQYFLGKEETCDLAASAFDSIVSEYFGGVSNEHDN